MEATSGPKTQGADKQQAHQESREKRRSRRRRRRRQRQEGEVSEFSATHSATRRLQVASESNKKTSETTTTTLEAQYSTRKTSSSSTNSTTTRDNTDSCNIQTNLSENPTSLDQGIAPTSPQQHRQQEETLVVTLQDKNNNIVDTTETHIQTIQQSPNNPSDQLRVQTTTTATTTNLSSVNAVRVLFQDQHQHQHQQQLLLQQRTNSGTLYSDRDNRAEAALEQQSSNVEQPRQPPVINLNRQLIERQLEAIQAADSERWNFDFRQSRPLRIEGHRYQVVQCPRPSCRTLNERSDQNNQQQHQERLPTGQGSDCKQTHRDKPDRKQDDARQ